MRDPFGAELARGVLEFNAGRFFDAHEVWEELWIGARGPDRAFLQGLIQAAAGCYHLSVRNLDGARSQISRGLERLAPYRPAHRGFDLDALAAQLEALLERIPEGTDPASLEGKLEAPKLRAAEEG